MGLLQKMVRINGVVTYQAQQSSPVAVPVGLSETRCFAFGDAEKPTDILCHRAVDVREYVRAGVMQGVVEVEQPGARRVSVLARHRLVALDQGADPVIGQNFQ